MVTLQPSLLIFRVITEFSWHSSHHKVSKATSWPLTQCYYYAITQLNDQRTSQQVTHSLKHQTAYLVSQAATQPVSPPPVPANLVRNQLRLCLLSSPCLQLICSSLMQLSCVLRAERHNKVIRLIRLAAPLLSPYAHYTYSIRCVMRFCTPSTRCCFVCVEKRAFLGLCVCVSTTVCVCENVFGQGRAYALAEEICSIYILSLAWNKCALELSAPVSVGCKHFTLADDHSIMHTHTDTLQKETWAYNQRHSCANTHLNITNNTTHCSNGQLMSHMPRR